jgi:hypothetical protein
VPRKGWRVWGCCRLENNKALSSGWSCICLISSLLWSLDSRFFSGRRVPVREGAATVENGFLFQIFSSLVDCQDVNVIIGWHWWRQSFQVSKIYFRFCWQTSSSPGTSGDRWKQNPIKRDNNENNCIYSKKNWSQRKLVGWCDSPPNVKPPSGSMPKSQRLSCGHTGFLEFFST